jgi:serine/threonine protein kinase
MNAPASELDEAERPRAATMKFTYPSGSRPLEGYTIKRGVGRGGFGEVYFATSDAGKEVALKLIRRNLDVELRGVTQCLNLKHPNLIALYDIRTDEMGDQWVVMEYVSGESLEEVIDRNPDGLPVEEALWWMRGMCAGVAYLHDHGIVHRDLKPGNIFSDEGTVKIGDYGLAKFISCSRRSGQTESVGTVHYMAPEIANGRYGREIDTYALGIILFEMLTGRVPFEGESVGEVLMKHLTAEPDLSALEPPYREIVERALAKDPQVRINNVNELVALLPGGGDVVLTPIPPAAMKPQTKPAFLFERGPALKAADAAAADGLKQLVNVKRPVSGIKPEEPIWKAIRDNFLGENLHRMQPLKKGILLFAIVALCMWYGGEIVQFAIPLLICYWIYYAVWSSATKRHAGGSDSEDHEQMPVAAVNRREDQQTAAWPISEKDLAAPARQPKPMGVRKRLRASWRDRALQELTAKPWREKFSELLGSMLLAALFAAAASSISILLLADQPASERMATYLWLAAVGTLGSWAILIPAKFAEGKLEDQAPMRLTLFSLGALVGLSAWFVGDMLLLKSPRWGEPVDVGQGLITHEMLGLSTGASNVPNFTCYVAYFAFLFLIVRWWRQAEFTRKTRMSLWSVLICVLMAWVLHIFWWFPQPTGMMAAGVIAMSTQLASPWMPPSRRRALSEQIDQAVT